MSNKYQVEYGTSVIPFTVKYSDRKTLAIAVYPDRSVQVTAPMKSSIDKVIERVEKRASWILKKIRKYSKHDISKQEHEWVSGESMFYLGRQYRLKVLKGDPNIKLIGKYLLVSVVDKRDAESVKQLVNSWYKQQAKKKYEIILEKNATILRREKIKLNQLTVRKLEKRWGSCTNKGNIILNVDLVKTPVDCINYVIVHELCHLKHLNHSKKFFSTLTKYCPEWPKLKEKLECKIWV
jgi:predicted metal-dependent hydrolase